MREDGDAVAEREREDADRELHLDTLRHVDEGAVGKEGLVERGELGGTEPRRLGEEVLADQIAVTGKRTAEGVDDHALLFQRRIHDFARDERPVGERQSGGLLDPH